MPYDLPKLKYGYEALEPYIDARTMEIHHTKHHAGYINNLNAAIKDYGNLQNKPVEELLGSIDKIPEIIRTTVRNNAGGHTNHSLFWEIMSPKSGGSPQAELLQAVKQNFGAFEKFKESFTTAALTRFGSGWAWLVLNKDKKLEIISTANQDNPLMDKKIAILGLDVWEHAYYLKYQNRRLDYINAWWNIVDWTAVLNQYKSALSKV